MLPLLRLPPPPIPLFHALPLSLLRFFSSPLSHSLTQFPDFRFPIPVALASQGLCTCRGGSSSCPGQPSRPDRKEDSTCHGPRVNMAESSVRFPAPVLSSLRLSFATWGVCYGGLGSRGWVSLTNFKVKLMTVLPVDWCFLLMSGFTF